MTWLEMMAANPTIARPWFDNYWIIPVGVIALYFYGRAHFNTPNYALGGQDGAVVRGSLLTPAPPIFTTYRSRFNRYALWYVLLLEAVFLVFVFFTSVIADIASILNLSLPKTTSDTVQARALLALFFLTGLLSSFPGFKDLDGWILRKLHQAALIPDDARLLANQLFDAPFKPHAAVATNVKTTLVSRDTLRVAEGSTTGSLERTVVKALCLLSQLQHKLNNGKYNRFQVIVEKDLNDIVAKRDVLRPALIAYFKEQATIVPDTVPDIDQYLEDNAANPQVAQLIEKRSAIASRCEDVLYRMCLIVALLVYATKFSPEAVGDALSDLGFNVNVRSRGIMDWDAVFRVTGGMFVIMLALNATFALFVYLFNLQVAPAFAPGRASALRFAVLGTLLYFLAMMIAIKFKKHWPRDPDLYRQRPENILVATYAYLFTIPINVGLALWLRNFEFTIAPLLFALNQGVVAYFIGVYIDRSLNERPADWRLSVRQGVAQGVAVFAAFFLSPPIPVPGVPLSEGSQFALALFFAVQTAGAGFLIGWLFQYYYRRTKAASGAPVGDITLQLRAA